MYTHVHTDAVIDGARAAAGATKRLLGILEEIASQQRFSHVSNMEEVLGDHLVTVLERATHIVTAMTHEVGP